MAQLYSTVTAARELSVHKATISRHAKRLRLGQRVGRAMMFSAAELAKLRRAVADSRPGPKP